MSSRISCWLNGHDWGALGRRRLGDIFGNLWRLQTCQQCRATRRVLHMAWHERP